MSEEMLGLSSMHPRVREKLPNQLRVLKRGAGLTPKVTSYSLGFLRFFGATTPSSAYKLLRTALESMNPSRLYVQALLNSYGGEGLADDLNTRRADFAEKHGLSESRVIDLEDFALDEMIQVLDALARGEEIKPSKLDEEPSFEASSVEEPAVKELLISLIEATREQTAVQRETNELLKRIAAAWTA